MKKIFFVFPVVFISFVAVCSSEEPGRSDEAVGNYSRIAAELQKYNFVFDAFPDEELPFLMGNSEMGGLASKSGTGFPFMWFADVWKNPSSRTSLLGFQLSNSAIENTIPDKYFQQLDISSGILNTSYLYDEGSYESEIFLSMDDLHLMVLKIKNTGEKPCTWELLIPGKTDGFRVSRIHNKGLEGITTDSLFRKSFWNIENHRAAPLDSFFTKVRWCLTSTIQINESKGDFDITLNPNESAVFTYRVFTGYDQNEYLQQPEAGGINVSDFEILKDLNTAAWKKQYDNTAAIILPEGDYAKLFYRSMYMLFATSGSRHFLPGETQFGTLHRDIGHLADRSFSNCLWDMNPFTYGAAGWSAMAFTTLGNEKLAFNMLNWFYQPESLKKNVTNMFPVGKYTLHFRGDTVGNYHYLKGDNPNAMTFGHENKTNMENFNWFGDGSHVDWQIHYNAFVSSIFHMYSSFYPNDEFLHSTTYPLLKGLAEFWKELLNWNDEINAYVLPGLVSLTEDLVAENPLDAAISAKWNLLMAAEYAQRLGLDRELREEWRRIANLINIPQNDKYYLEFFKDDGQRSGGGYQGIRGMVYLAYPVKEIIPLLDREKIRRTLDRTWERNNAGKSSSDAGHTVVLEKPELNLEQLSGMITFVANWFALAEAYAGSGDNAYDVSSYCLTKLDTAGNILFETDNLRPYYMDSYASFVIVPPSMLVQSMNDTIKVFPAVPGIWKDISFYDLPAENGIRVSGKMTGGAVEWIKLHKEGKEIAMSREKTNFEVKIKNNRVIVNPIK